MRHVGFVGVDEEKILRCGLTVEHVYNFCKQLMLDELKNGLFIFVSGGCPKKGIDIICERVADELKLEKLIIKPETNNWYDEIVSKCPKCGSLNIEKNITCLDCGYEYFIMNQYVKKGYRSRNKMIAKISDVLYCLTISEDEYCYHCNMSNHKRNGGCYTLKEYKNLGKQKGFLVTM